MKRPLAMVCLACILMVWLGMMVFPDHQFPGKEIEAFDGSLLTLEGTVYKKEEQISYNQKILLLYLKEVSVQTSETSVTTFSKNNKVICYVKQYFTGSEPQIGERVKAEGEFELYLSATNPGQFDSKTYYQTMGICGKLSSVRIVEKSNSPAEVAERLYHLRKYFAQQIDDLYEEKEAGVMKALLLGIKSEMDDEVENMYKRNGIIHAVSISGLHVTCIGMAIYMMLRKLWLPIPVAGTIAAGCVILYGIMIGQPTSAYRAIVMFLLKILADVIGRTYDMLTALTVAALLLVLQEPLYLKNAGFLLSFGCVLGIILIYPVLIKQLEKERDREKEKQFSWKLKQKMKEGVCAGFSILLMTLPIQLSFYYEYPLISLLWNLLVVPTVGIILQSGMVQLIFSPWISFVGEMLSVSNMFFLRIYELICRLGDNIPFQKMILGCPSSVQIAVYYGLLVSGIWLLKYGKKKWKLRDARYGVSLLVLAIVVLSVRPMNGIRLTFADVGQGDCILLQTKSGEASIFDCGSSSKTKCGEYILTPMVKYYGIRIISGIYVSHPDSDHMNGILELIENSRTEKIHIEKIVLPYPVNEEVREGFTELVVSARDNEIPVYYMETGQSLIQDDVKIECLYPKRTETAEGTNDASAVYLVTYKEFVALLTGDIEDTGEKKLTQVLKEKDIDHIDVLKVAHHGSRYSSASEFLEQIHPRVAVISCGEGNRYGHPHEETLKRLSAAESIIMTTPEYGAVTMEVFLGGRIAVSYWGNGDESD